MRWVCNCIRYTGIHHLALSGGVFMNVKVNKAISELPEVESLFVFPSCGDESNSIGAAYWAYAKILRSQQKAVEIEKLQSLYLGPAYDDAAILQALKAVPQRQIEYHRCEDIEREVAHHVAKGEIVARLKGRMEFGARALGNRSILARADRPEVVKVINDMIKCRDFWMPFAPSILEEYQTDYLVNPKNISAPYMITAFDTTDRVSEIKAAVHPYDFSVRPQVVQKSWNPEYHRLISIFRQITGSGAILNTSFNLHGYPIVCRPEHALHVFFNSELTKLAMGSYLIHKPNAVASVKPISR